MYNNSKVSATDLPRIGKLLLTEALNALEDLTLAADCDIYTDAPECQVSVNQVQDTIQKAYDVLYKIHVVLASSWVRDHHEPNHADALVRRILNEAEGVFTTTQARR